MMRKLVVVPTVVVLAACASTQSTSGSVAQSAAASGGVVRWSGNFKQTKMPTAQIGAATPNRGFGTITVARAAGETDRVHVELSVNAPVAPGTQIAWAIFDGACGSAAPMVTGENQFPIIEINGTGAGYVKTDMSLTLDPRASYHANVYWTTHARDLGDVMMCAPLAASGR
jgi:hypothetical protein